MRYLAFTLAFIFTACTGDAVEVGPDAAPDAILIQDAGLDAAPDAPEHFAPCADVCPTEELTPWRVNGAYVWSYCLPSYQRCTDPSQH